MSWRRWTGFALRMYAAAVFASILAAALSWEWGSDIIGTSHWWPWASRRVELCLIATLAIVPPWACLAFMVLRRHRLGPWLALGGTSAALPLGVGAFGARAVTDRLVGFADSVSGIIVLLGAALAVLIADRLEKTSLDWRWRVTGVGLGVVLPWLPAYLACGFIGALPNTCPSWDAPQAIIAAALLVVGGVAVARGRACGLVFLLAGTCALALIQVPAPVPTCFGPQGHPFGYGDARSVIALGASVALAPWVLPVARALMPRPRAGR